MQRGQQTEASTSNTELTDDSPPPDVPLGNDSVKKDTNVESAVPVDVTSIITQVERDAPSQPANRIRKAPPPQRRSFISRLFCCAPKPGSGPGQISLVVPSSHSFMMNRRQHSAEKARSTASTEVVSSSRHYMKKCLALDLDETLVHSSFQPVECSFTINVCIDGVSHNIYVLKRPGVDQFLQRLSEHYELIIYTASLSKYADPLLDLLDPKRLLSRRLFRENCVFYDGHYVKDLSLLSRDISQTIIVDNCPNSYIFHPENAIDCSSFFDDPSDVELWQIADFLESIRGCDDVRAYCRSWREWCKHNPSSVPANYGGESV